MLGRCLRGRCLRGRGVVRAPCMMYGNFATKANCVNKAATAEKLAAIAADTDATVEVGAEIARISIGASTPAPTAAPPASAGSPSRT